MAGLSEFLTFPRRFDDWNSKSLTVEAEAFGWCYVPVIKDAIEEKLLAVLVASSFLATLLEAHSVKGCPQVLVVPCFSTKGGVLTRSPALIVVPSFLQHNSTKEKSHWVTGCSHRLSFIPPTQ